jgi:hypothetical protein
MKENYLYKISAGLERRVFTSFFCNTSYFEMQNFREKLAEECKKMTEYVFKYDMDLPNMDRKELEKIIIELDQILKDEMNQSIMKIRKFVK